MKSRKLICLLVLLKSISTHAEESFIPICIASDGDKVELTEYRFEGEFKLRHTWWNPEAIPSEVILGGEIEFAEEIIETCKGKVESLEKELIDIWARKYPNDETGK